VEQLAEHCFRVAVRVARAERIHRIAPVVVVAAGLGGIQVQVDPVESQLPQVQLVPVAVVVAAEAERI
jgi:hypothetical protein